MYLRLDVYSHRYKENGKAKPSYNRAHGVFKGLAGCGSDLLAKHFFFVDMWERLAWHGTTEEFAEWLLNRSSARQQDLAQRKKYDNLLGKSEAEDSHDGPQSCPSSYVRCQQRA